METKQSIRKLILAKRESCSDEFVKSASRKITEKILGLDEYQKAETLLVYLDYRNETVTRYLIEEAWRMGKRIGVPKVRGVQMDFYEIHSFEGLEPGSMGIPEPADTAGRIPVCPEDALVIMPGVAFDRSLHRIGYGGGYYDRFLSIHPGMTRMAAAFDFQVLEEIPAGENDISPDLIVTENQIFRKK